jgi:hypothetical protein
MDNLSTSTLSDNFNELEAAFKMKKWFQLNESELETLVVICELNGIKHDIYEYLFKGATHGSNYGQQVWKKINALEDQKLVWIERDIDKRVQHFHFHNDLKAELKNALPQLFVSVNTPEKNDTFKFALRKETTKIVGNQPEYSGMFRLQKSVNLKEGQEYSYGGWVNDDGNIFIKIVPVENNILTNLDGDKYDAQTDSKTQETDNEIPF